MSYIFLFYCNIETHTPATKKKKRPTVSRVERSDFFTDRGDGWEEEDKEETAEKKKN